MNYLEIFLTTFGACAVAIVGAWAAVLFALHRFRVERRWERREEGYRRILHALAQFKDYLDTHYDAQLEGSEVPDGEATRLRQQARDARKEIKLAVDLGSYLLSREARDRLARFETEERAASNKPSWFEYLEAAWTATKSCIEELSQMASTDLRL